MPTPAPNQSAGLSGYATDEDACVEGGADFAAIVPKSNLVASGADGVFAAGSPWTLASASNLFAAQGVAPGMVVQLTGPLSAFKAPQYLAVQSVQTSSVTLRRCGFAAGAGLPPAPAAGLTGVAFSVLTLAPQIELAAFELDEQFSVDPLLANRRPSDLYDQRVFRRLTVLRVFYLQYMNINRSKAGDFADKQAHYQAEYQSALDRASVRWGPVGSSLPTSTRFSTRIER